MRAVCTILAATLALGAGPAAADRAMLGVLASGRMFADRPLLRGYALCLLGNGDPAALGTLMAEAGAERSDETEMGATFYTLDAPFDVSVYQDGAICDVSSEEIGTDVALQNLIVVGGMTGFAMIDGECPGLRLGDTVTATLTSSGNDPTCPPAETSNVRFEFGDGAGAPADPAPAPAQTK